VFIDGGQILEDRPTADFFDQPGSERAAAFLSKILHH
jgi:glutamate/aspartate transport system ATP-binding protein